MCGLQQGKSREKRWLAGWPPGRDLPLGDSVLVASPFHALRAMPIRSGIRSGMDPGESVSWGGGGGC